MYIHGTYIVICIYIYIQYIFSIKWPRNMGRHGVFEYSPVCVDDAFFSFWLLRIRQNLSINIYCSVAIPAINHLIHQPFGCSFFLKNIYPHTND